MHYAMYHVSKLENEILKARIKVTCHRPVLTTIQIRFSELIPIRLGLCRIQWGQNILLFLCVNPASANVFSSFDQKNESRQHRGRQ